MRTSAAAQSAAVGTTPSALAGSVAQWWTWSLTVPLAAVSTTAIVAVGISEVPFFGRAVNALVYPHAVPLLEIVVAVAAIGFIAAVALTIVAERALRRHALGSGLAEEDARWMVTCFREARSTGTFCFTPRAKVAHARRLLERFERRHVGYMDAKTPTSVMLLALGSCGYCGFSAVPSMETQYLLGRDELTAIAGHIDVFLPDTARPIGARTTFWVDSFIHLEVTLPTTDVPAVLAQVDTAANTKGRKPLDLQRHKLVRSELSDVGRTMPVSTGWTTPGATLELGVSSIDESTSVMVIHWFGD